MSVSDYVQFLGSGTSLGVPMLGCGCDVCSSTDPRDKRLRSSIFVSYKGLNIVVDAGPDFRCQLLRAGIKHIDAILLTHNHKDHTGGLDDLRAFNYFEKRAMPIYCEDYVYESLKLEYSYVFAEYKYPGIPRFDIKLIDDNPFCIDGVEIVPIRARHYKLPVLGYRFGNFAYLTDANAIPEQEYDKLRGLDLFVISTVREKRHISHFTLSEALAVAQRVGAKRTLLTHMSHQLPRYELLKDMLPAGVEPAYDGLIINI